ncbi:TetR/AcrR family transcriptional regulator [Alteromonas gracilis]|jgi:AcrR family transcriptional regulator|uniref:TetR family transcriptional regulator n=1 Tax=Alteromonas gracilis TaxID=1479524 RepID=A0ABX5CNB3_9ALTE|nr:TetR/AcrR family transcriptional regulator [Alteromonas gracilis]APD86278.1 TetR family transcriptional regulator [Alteromonas sp. Mex14]PRO69054.1 TetR family transcriptional regulator [Alteromonas gracilis]
MARHTKTDILDAAEYLFSQSGFTQTSMREITARAEVNLASVNYHFGSKKNLIQAVFKRYFDQLMPEVKSCLASLPHIEGVKGVEQLLYSLIPPMINLNTLSTQGTATFVKLLGRGYNETQGHLRKFLMNDYGDCIRALVDAIRRCLPELPEEELFWRLHFAMGSFVFSMASSQALTEIAESDFHKHVDIEEVIQHLVPFVAQGLAGK